MTQLRIHPTLQPIRIEWKDVHDDEVRAAAAARAGFTGLAFFDCARGLVVEWRDADWDTLYFKAILASHNVAQWDKVHIYVRGAERGWLSGQA